MYLIYKNIKINLIYVLKLGIINIIYLGLRIYMAHTQYYMKSNNSHLIHSPHVVLFSISISLFF